MFEQRPQNGYFNLLGKGSCKNFFDSFNGMNN